MDKLLIWLEGKKTYLCALGMIFGMIAVAFCLYVKLLTMEQAVTVLAFLATTFGAGGLAALRGGVKKDTGQSIK
jgi:hypothetical protein